MLGAVIVRAQHVLSEGGFQREPDRSFGVGRGAYARIFSGQKGQAFLMFDRKDQAVRIS
jgi:hypothetical protein